MKKSYIFLTVVFALAAMSAGAQSLVWQTGIIQTNVNLRGAPVVMGIVSAAIPSAGKVVVRFDGQCISDSGDRIIIAASNTHNWSTDDGNEGIQVANAAQGQRSFSHSRVYSVTAGTDSFYAVAENYVDQNGSGLASIYGSLTVEFFPASGNAVVADTGSWWSGNLRGSAVVLASVPLTASAAGKVIVHFDGVCNSDPLDEIVLAASNTSNWGVNDGNVDLIAANAGYNYSPFTHTREYDVTAGSYNFNGIGQNYVITGGTGTAYVGSNLTAEYFPTGGSVQAYMHGISTPSVNLRGAAVAIDSITFNAPAAGKVLVQFDGLCTSSFGDLIILAASSTPYWGTNDGNIGVSAASASNTDNCFSHSRLYNVAAGSHTFYAVAQNYINEGGTGLAYISASLVVKYFGPAPTDVTETTASAKGFEVYPNPATNNVAVRFDELQKEGTLELTGITGELISKIDVGNAQLFNINLSGLAAGMYFVKCNGLVKKILKQ